MGGRTRSWWGWGWSDQALSDAECTHLAAVLPGAPGEPIPVPDLAGLQLRKPRVAAPRALAGCCSEDPADRAGHSYGKAYRDVMRALRGDFSTAPDLVAYPAGEADVVDLLGWATDANLAVGSSRSPVSPITGCTARLPTTICISLSISLRNPIPSTGSKLCA
ncbi:MAG: hypothetical protein ACRDRV_09300 [Pseudonocardiaceae bacterium]